MKAFEIFRKDSEKKIGEGVVWYDGSVSTRCAARDGDAYDTTSFHTSMIQCAAHFERCQCTISFSASLDPAGILTTPASDRFTELYPAPGESKLRDQVAGSLKKALGYVASPVEVELGMQIRVLLEILDERTPRP